MSIELLMGMIVDLIHGKKFPEMLKKGIVCVAVLGVGVLVYMWLSHVIYPNIDNETPAKLVTPQQIDRQTYHKDTNSRSMRHTCGFPMSFIRT